MQPLRHMVSPDDLTHDELVEIFHHTREFKKVGKAMHDHFVKGAPVSDDIRDRWRHHRRLCDGRRIKISFHQASTRTKDSFGAAMLELGGMVISTENAGQFSSAAKGESLTDDTMVTGEYGHTIVLRHHTKGSAAQAADVSIVPIINGGDGTGDHPTQAWLDHFSIVEHHGTRDDLTVTLVGDPLRSRTIHSLLQQLTRHRGKQLGVARRFKIVASKAFQLPPDDRLILEARKAGIEVEQVITDRLTPEVLRESDVVYMTRMQSEYALGSGRAAQMIGKLLSRLLAKPPIQLTPSLALALPANAVILHPLPRNSELPTSIDADPRAKYIEQAGDGLYLRMALLDWLFNRRFTTTTETMSASA